MKRGFVARGFGGVDGARLDGAPLGSIDGAQLGFSRL